MKIGILVIATNKYTQFVNPLVESINKYFLPDYKKTIFLFTNKMEEIYQENVIKIFQEHMKWPLPTLKRYEIFYNNRKSFNGSDILYYLDADMLINDYVGEEILPTEDKKIVAVIHPGNSVSNMITSYERNPKSTACVYDIPSNYLYHCGGVQGGKKSSYLNVCKILSENINIDMNNGIKAVWDDESHWNCYLINNPDVYKELDSSYCYPESWTIPFKKIILALDKTSDFVSDKK